ncbi:hypothetical protein llap_9878 [Limosa lapponica baueri]|uniref:Uncharacterized protein n=1 Tax=Limosa lapponica baueri TaxID=1758121 RepID=A0A2I0U176_LIMLA|nr:hypothetical protein llap_9878 [Limosa lapponica baueri]
MSTAVGFCRTRQTSPDAVGGQGACSPLSQREAHFPKACPDGIGLCPGVRGAEDEETGREEAEEDALRKSLLQQDRMTEAKTAVPHRNGTQRTSSGLLSAQEGILLGFFSLYSMPWNL